MRTGQTFPLPKTEQEYRHLNETVTRRSIEQHFEDLRVDVVSTRDILEKDGSLALRRFQFLLMGA